MRVNIPGYPNEVDIPADCIPPDGGPVRFYLTQQGPMVYRAFGVATPEAWQAGSDTYEWDDDEYYDEDWDDDP